MNGFRYIAVVLACLTSGGAAPARADDVPAGPEWVDNDLVPAQWRSFPIRWKATWEETFEENLGYWRSALAADPKLSKAQAQIISLRKIYLQQALLKRWPNHPGGRASAYVAIADELGRGRLADEWGHSWYCWRMVRDFPGDPDVRQGGYYRLIHGTTWWGYPDMPELGDWHFTLRAALGDWVAGRKVRDYEAWFAYLGYLNSQRLLDPDYYGAVCELVRYLDGRKGSQDKLDYAKGVLCQNFIGQRGLAPFFYGKAKASDRAAKLPRTPDASPLELARDARTERRWGDLRAEANLIGPKVLARRYAARDILKGLVDRGSLVAIGKDHAVSLWRDINRQLRARAPQEIRALRAAQEDAVPRLALRTDGSMPQTEMMQLLRQYPWAASMHEFLAEAGEQALRRGRAHWAIPMFRDILYFSDDAQLRLTAHVGLWLAMAQDGGDREGLREAMAAVGDDVLVPWRGSRAPAAKAKREILSAAVRDNRRAPEPAAAAVPVELPAAWYWSERRGPAPNHHAAGPIDKVQAMGGAVFVAGPGGVARYDTGSARPRWVAGLPEPQDGPQKPPHVPSAGPWWLAPDGRPATVFGPSLSLISSIASPSAGRAGRSRVVCVRRLRRAPGGLQAYLAAFGVKSGKALWSTVDRAEWRDLRPLGDPTTAGGDTYVLAVQVQANGKGPWPICLVGLDPFDGTIRWRRQVSVRRSLPPPDYDAGAVTVHHGQVYCAPGAGFVARCDARDGAVEWVSLYRPWSPGSSRLVGRKYRGVRVNFPPLLHARRRGALAVTGNTIVLLPHDHGGVLAMDRTTGKVLWETFFIPGRQILGIRGQVAVFQGGRWLGALDVRSGKTLWQRDLPSGTCQTAALVGDEVRVLHDNAIRRFRAETGEDRGQTALAEAPGTQRILLQDGRRVEVVQALPAPHAGGEAPAPTDGTGGPPAWARAWTLPRANPALWLPEQSGLPAGTACVLSEQGLTRVRLGRGRTNRVEWARTLSGRPRCVSLHADVFAVGGAFRVEGLNPATGETRWATPVPFRAETVGTGHGIVFAAQPRTQCHVAAIDAATGKRLWTRPVNGPRLQYDVNGTRVTVERRADGGPAVCIYRSRALFGDEGWQPGRIVLDARSGKCLDFEKFRLPGSIKWPPYIRFAGKDVAYISAEGRPHIRPTGGGADLAAGWTRRATPHTKSKTPTHVGLWWQGRRVYMQSKRTVWGYDAAAKKETAFQVAPEPAPAIGPDGKPVPNKGAMRFCNVLDVLDADGRLFVVSLQGGRASRRDPVRAEVVLAAFDRNTGASLGSRSLPGIVCAAPGQPGHPTRAVFHNGVLLVTDGNGLHVFTPAGT